MKTWIKRLLLAGFAGVAGIGICLAGTDPTNPTEPADSTEARERGRDLFQIHCILCHGKRGDGKSVKKSGRILLLRGKPPDFNNPDWRNQMSPQIVFTVVRDGKEDTSMPSFSDRLTESEIWDVTSYVLSIYEKGP
jgi:mono/diheme cytochrome c family protein